MATERDDYLLRIAVQVQNDRALQQLTQSLNTASKAAPQAGKAVQTATKNTAAFGRTAQNASYQLQDFIVQVQGGTDPMRALGQQLPQMLAGFTGIGVAIAGLTAAALPVLVTMLSDTEEKTADLEKVVGEAETAWRNYADALERVDESGDSVDKTIARLLETIATGQQRSALSALQQDAQNLLKTAGDLSRVGGDDRGFLGDLKELTRGAADKYLTGGLLGFADAAERFSAGMAQIDRFGGRENLEAFSRLVSGLNETNIGPTISGLVSLAEQMEGVASPDLIDQIQQYALRLDQMRTSASSVNDVLKEIDLDKIADPIRAKTLTQRAPTLSGITPYGGDPEILARLTDHQKAMSDEIARSNELFRQFNPQVAQYRDLMYDLDEALRLGVISQAEYDTKVADAGKKLDESLEGWTLGKEAVEVFDSSFQTMLDGVLQGTTSLSDGIKSMVKVMIAELAKLAAYKFIANTFAGTAIGDAAAGLLPNAKGNAFINGQVTAFARGGVVNGPTVFPMANGMGLMGEAGPEAVMPLSRDSRGRLGVSAGMPNITINNNAPGVDITPRQTDNGLTIDVVMSQLAMAVLRGGNPMSDAMERTYTLGRGRGAY